MDRSPNEGVIAVQEHFTVVSEGDGWIMVDKGAPLIVHPANNRKEEPTLLGGVQELLAYDIINGARLSIINRLDRETSGLVLMATNKKMARDLSRAMERREVEKCYEALVWGWPEWGEVKVDASIIRKGEVEESKIYVKQMVHEKGKGSVTFVRLKKKLMVSGKRASLLSVDEMLSELVLPRHALHSSHMRIAMNGEQFSGYADLAGDIEALLQCAKADYY